MLLTVFRHTIFVADATVHVTCRQRARTAYERPRARGARVRGPPLLFTSECNM